MAYNNEQDLNTSYSNGGDKKGRNNVLLILLLLLLLASGGLNVYQYTHHEERVKEMDHRMQEELISTEELKTRLETQIKGAQEQLEEYKGRNAKLDAEIEKDQRDLVAKAEQIGKLLKSNKISYNKYLEAKDKLDEMTFLKEKYMKQVAELNEKNKALTKENETLHKEVDEGKHTINTLTDEVTSKSNKLSLAQRLTADNISVTGVYFKKNNKEVESTKSKNIDKLKFCFTVSANIAAYAGKKDVFIQLLDPRGQTIAIESLGSGITTIDATQAQYTTKEQIDYQNEAQNFCVYWGKGSAFEPGNYKAVISTEGYKLGEKEFRIK